jgi:hypothetical protein
MEGDAAKNIPGGRNGTSIDAVEEIHFSLMCGSITSHALGGSSRKEKHESKESMIACSVMGVQFFCSSS